MPLCHRRSPQLARRIPGDSSSWRSIPILRPAEKVLEDQVVGGAKWRNAIIEKLEANSDVRASVFLMAADDEGRLCGEADFHPRERQNVVFEAGMFIGKLGRGQVAFVVDPGIELPSDITGTGYIEHKGNWEFELLRELKNMGFDVDANRLLGWCLPCAEGVNAIADSRRHPRRCLLL